MIKGAIEAVSDHEVSGWLASELGSARGRTVLAFLDQECVGIARIEHFRQDLADAGLGDGFSGFSIPVRLPSPKDRTRLTVRLEGSDLALLSPNARVAPKGAVQAQARRQAVRSPGMLQWMLGRGWLAQPDYDFLKFFDRMGVYERSLLAKAGESGADRTILDPAAIAKGILEIYAMEEVELSKQQLRTAKEFEPAFARLRETSDILPLVALWSGERGKVGVVEGSHAREAEEDEALPAHVDYLFGPDRLLILSLGCAVVLQHAAPQGGMTLFTGTARK